MRRVGLAGALLGIAALEASVAGAYYARGTWWHYLLHQYVGWGLGLGAAALLWALTGRRVPALVAMLAGQLVSIVPDLMFRYLRMPHEVSMDLWVGHISLHRGPSPLLVATSVLLLGGLSWALAATRPRGAVATALAGPLLLLAACLAAEPIPTRLSDYPAETAVVVPR